MPRAIMSLDACDIRYIDIRYAHAGDNVAKVYGRRAERHQTVIESIEIANVASFSEPTVIQGLKKKNFIFGTNGTGKTTVSRIIDSPNKFPEASIRALLQK